MEFSDWCRYWVIIQMVANVVCYRGNASGSTNTAQGCVGSRLDLRCPSTKIIRVINVHLGVSGCGGIRCCIEDAGCSHKPSEEHVKYVNDTCEGQQNCTIEINFFNSTPCRVGWWNNQRTVYGHAFERITYICAENIVQGCVGSRLDLQCPLTKIIGEINVHLGVSGCNAGSCCIKDAGCSHEPSEEHMKSVNDTCESQQSCTIEINFFNATPCRVDWRSNNQRTVDGHAFERISYICAKNNETSTDGTPTILYILNTEADGKSNAEPMREGSSSLILTVVVVCVICPVVLIGIIASVSVVVIRRKKKQQAQSSDAVKMSDIRKEDVQMNEAQGTPLYENVVPTFPIGNNGISKVVETSLNSGATNLETPTSDYCELGGVVRGKIQCDSEYEHLDIGRNCEPSNVYEKLQ